MDSENDVGSELRVVGKSLSGEKSEYTLRKMSLECKELISLLVGDFCC